MDYKEFEGGILALHNTQPPVSVSKIANLTSLAIKHSENSAEVAQCIGRFIKEASPQMRLSGLYVIDSISRAAFKNPEAGGSSYLSLFEAMIEDLVPYFKQVPQSDEERVKRTIMLWKKTGIFSTALICKIKKSHFSTPKEEVIKSPKLLSQEQDDSPYLKPTVSEAAIQFLEQLKNTKEPTEEQVKQSLIHAAERLDHLQCSNPLRSLLAHIEQTASLRELAKNISPLILLEARKISTQPDQQESDKSTLPNASQKNKYRESQSAIPSAPMVVAAAVPFGKKQQKPQQHQNSHAYSHEQQDAELSTQNNDSDYSQLRYQNTWSGYKSLVPPYYVGRPQIDPRSGLSQINRSNSSIYDDVQGRPIPVFDSERGAEKSSLHLHQQHVPQSTAKSNKPGDCIPGYIDPHLSKKYFKVLTRTVYIGGITQSITKEELRDLFETIARVDTVTVNYPKFNAFVKFLTRAEAELAREYFQDFHWKGTILKMGWGCGYGPKEYFDYNSGETVFPISRMTDTEKRIISCSSRGGGPIVGCMVVEEPDFGWPQKGEVCHGEYARGQVPHAPGYLRTLAERDWFKAQALSSEFSLNKLATLKNRIPKYLPQDQTSSQKIDKTASRPLKENFPATSQSPEIGAQMPIPLISSVSSAANGNRQERFQIPSYFPGSRRPPNVYPHIQNRKRPVAHSFTSQPLSAPSSPASKFLKTADAENVSNVSTISIVSERRYNDENQSNIHDISVNSTIYDQMRIDHGNCSFF